jgi:hypothetical protein
MYGHNIFVRLHGFFCTLYTIIYVRFLYPICNPYVGFMKSKKAKIKPKLAKKAKISQKKTKFFKKKPKKSQKTNLPKKPKLSKKFFFGNLNFFEKFKLFLKFLDFLEQVCCLSFRRLHKDYIDREYMTQSR